MSRDWFGRVRVVNFDITQMFAEKVDHSVSHLMSPVCVFLRRIQNNAFLLGV